MLNIGLSIVFSISVLSTINAGKTFDRSSYKTNTRALVSQQWHQQKFSERFEPNLSNTSDTDVLWQTIVSIASDQQLVSESNQLDKPSKEYAYNLHRHSILGNYARILPCIILIVLMIQQPCDAASCEPGKDCSKMFFGCTPGKDCTKRTLGDHEKRSLARIIKEVGKVFLPQSDPLDRRSLRGGNRYGYPLKEEMDCSQNNIWRNAIHVLESYAHSYHTDYYDMPYSKRLVSKDPKFMREFIEELQNSVNEAILIAVNDTTYFDYHEKTTSKMQAIREMIRRIQNLMDTRHTLNFYGGNANNNHHMFEWREEHYALINNYRAMETQFKFIVDLRKELEQAEDQEQVIKIIRNREVYKRFMHTAGFGHGESLKSDMTNVDEYEVYLRSCIS